jgi:hypothetical protein
MSKKFKVIHSPNLASDFQKGVDWYKKITGDHKVGKRFVETAKKHIKTLETNALHNEIKYGEIRCLIIPKFPYRAHYRMIEEDHTVYVEAVLHTSESPDRWPKV